jgi:sulfite reductase beta subunit-like hemoprotein
LANGEVENGFQVRVGGGLSARPFFAKKLNMFVKPEQLIEVMEGVVGIFRDFGNRENRKKARIKFLVDEWGIEKFEAELRSRLSFTPEEAVEWADPLRVFRDHVGVHPQRQEGYSYVGAAILTGRMNDAQVYEIARLAEEYGDGTVRTTNQQNLVFSNVLNENVAALVEALAAVGIYTQASAIRRAAVACTGNEFCNLALTETKNLLIDIVQHLDRTVVIDEPIRINLNGCPNSCGQHHIGDIGLQGCLVKMGPGETVDGYDVSLGGRLGRDSKFVRPIWRKVPATNVKFAIENLLNGYQEVKEPDEDFSTFVDRHSDEELANLMKTAFAEGAEVAVAA